MDVVIVGLEESLYIADGVDVLAVDVIAIVEENVVFRIVVKNILYVIDNVKRIIRSIVVQKVDDSKKVDVDGKMDTSVKVSLGLKGMYGHHMYHPLDARKVIYVDCILVDSMSVAENVLGFVRVNA